MVKKGERLAVLWPCRFWGNSTAFRRRLGIAIHWQWSRKTLSPLVVHNNLQIDLNEPDLFLDSDSLSQLPKDLLTIPFLHDVLSEDFVFIIRTIPTVWALKAAFAALSMNTISR